MKAAFVFLLGIELACNLVSAAVFGTNKYEPEDAAVAADDTIANNILRFPWPAVDTDSAFRRSVIEERSAQKFAGLVPLLSSISVHQQSIKWLKESGHTSAALAMFVRAIKIDFYEHECNADDRGRRKMAADDDEDSYHEGQFEIYEVEVEFRNFYPLDTSEDRDAAQKFQSWLEVQTKPYLPAESPMHYPFGEQPSLTTSGSDCDKANEDVNAELIIERSVADDVQVATQVLAAINFLFQLGLDDHFAHFLKWVVEDDGSVDNLDAPALPLGKYMVRLDGSAEQCAYNNLFGNVPTMHKNQNKFHEFVNRVVASFFWRNAIRFARDVDYKIVTERIMKVAFEVRQVTVATQILTTKLYHAAHDSDLDEAKRLLEVYRSYFRDLKVFGVSPDGAEIRIGDVRRGVLNVMQTDDDDFGQLSSSINVLRTATDRPDLDRNYVRNVLARRGDDGDLELISDADWTDIVIRLRADIDRVDEGCFGCLPLYAAITYSAVDIVQLLLDEFNADPSGAPLLSAIHIPEKDIRVKLVAMLLRAGADVNLADEVSVTPLYVAAKLGRREVVKMLLENASVDRESCDGISALGAAAFTDRQVLVSDLVSSTKCFPNLRTQDLGIALAYFAGKGAVPDMKKVLELDKSVIDVNVGHIITRPKRTIYLLRGVLNAISMQGNKCWTPLTIAAASGQLDSVAFLLANGARIDCCAEQYESPIHVARQNGHEEIASILEAALKAEQDRNYRASQSISNSPLSTGNNDLELDS